MIDLTKLKTLVVLVAVLTASCGPNLGERMAIWVGSDADELIKANGPPDNIYTQANGETVLRFDNAWSYYDNVFERTHSGICKKFFVANTENKIVRWSYRGC